MRLMPDQLLDLNAVELDAAVKYAAASEAALGRGGLGI